MSAGYSKLIYNTQIDGPAVTASGTPSTVFPATLATLPPNFYDAIGQTLCGKIVGRISCAVTTPGTARFDVRLGGTVVFDGLAVPLNVVAQANVPFEFEFVLTLRAIGSAANFFGWGKLSTRALVGSPAAGTGPAGVELLPYNTQPVVGGNFNSAASNALDVFFTQTVGTGTMTVHQALIESHRWE